MFAAKGVPKKVKGAPLKDKFVQVVPKKDKEVQNAKQPKAKEEPPKLYYFCNFPGCAEKSTDSDAILRHFESAHGKNEIYCWECGNGVDDGHPCNTYFRSCPREKIFDNYRDLGKLQVKTAKDQQKMFAEEEEQQKKSAKKKKK